VPLDKSVDLEKIARGTTGFSGAELANLVNEAALQAAKKPEQANVNLSDFEEARDVRLLGGRATRSLQITPEELRVTAYHEAGHTLVRLLLPNETDPFHKVTIIPRGATLGVAYSLPEKDRVSETQAQMMGLLKTALGGRAAEEIMFNSVTSGASNDLEKATGLVRAMVCRFGMSPVLGKVILDNNDQAFQYSTETAALIDREIRTIMDSAYAQVIELLRSNKEKLDLLAQTLLEKETLDAADVYALLGIEPRVQLKFS
jgi:cell division protease FtsH